MNAIEIRDLEKHYPGFTLDRVNLTLPSGCILGLVGENGAGKSTTIRLILNMMKNDGGSIRVDFLTYRQRPGAHVRLYCFYARRKASVV